MKTTAATNEQTSLLSQDEWAFIKQISDLFPDRTPSIVNRFISFENIPAPKRLKAAQGALKKELRRGFTQRIELGQAPDSILDDVESIHEHSSNMRLILRRIFNREDLHPAVKSIPENKRKGFAKKAFRLATIHDMAEAITSDFTPVDMEIISKETKTRLEDLASRIIFQSYPDKHGMIERYEAKDGLKDEHNIDHLNKVVDILEGGVDCLAMNLNDDCFHEWMTTIEGGLKKYPTLSLSFASRALNDIRKLRRDASELVKDYPQIQGRRQAIIELVF